MLHVTTKSNNKMSMSHFCTIIQTRKLGGGGGGIPYNDLSGMISPERGTFFRLQFYSGASRAARGRSPIAKEMW